MKYLRGFIRENSVHKQTQVGFRKELREIMTAREKKSLEEAEVTNLWENTFEIIMVSWVIGY